MLFEKMKNFANFVNFFVPYIFLLQYFRIYVILNAEILASARIWALPPCALAHLRA